jgi:hypothetical protein
MEPQSGKVFVITCHSKKELLFLRYEELSFLKGDEKLEVIMLS